MNLTTRPDFLAEGLVIFGDNAYVSMEYMVTPYKNVRAGPKDEFNFFHSQLQINIEQAFGMLVKRWGVLQKPLPCQMGPVKQMALIFALSQLHNYCLGDADRWFWPILMIQINQAPYQTMFLLVPLQMKAVKTLLLICLMVVNTLMMFRMKNWFVSNLPAENCRKFRFASFCDIIK
jgi:hypothetical protein